MIHYTKATKEYTTIERTLIQQHWYHQWLWFVTDKKYGRIISDYGLSQIKNTEEPTGWHGNFAVDNKYSRKSNIKLQQQTREYMAATTEKN